MAGKTLYASGPLTKTQRQQRWRAKLKLRRQAEASQPVDHLLQLVRAWNAADEAEQNEFLALIYAPQTDAPSAEG